MAAGLYKKIYRLFKKKRYFLLTQPVNIQIAHFRVCLQTKLARVLENVIAKTSKKF